MSLFNFDSLNWKSLMDSIELEYVQVAVLSAESKLNSILGRLECPNSKERSAWFQLMFWRCDLFVTHFECWECRRSSMDTVFGDFIIWDNNQIGLRKWSCHSQSSDPITFNWIYHLWEQMLSKVLMTFQDAHFESEFSTDAIKMLLCTTIYVANAQRDKRCYRVIAFYAFKSHFYS